MNPVAPWISSKYGSPENNWGLGDYFSAKNRTNESPFHILRIESHNSGTLQKEKILDYFRTVFLVEQREPQPQKMAIGFAAGLAAGLALSVVEENHWTNNISKDVYLYEIEETENEKKKKALRAKIEEYRVLPDNFDGYGGQAPPARDIENALSFIPHLPNRGMDRVRTMVDGSGGVSFEWGLELDLEVGFSNGKISFYGDMPDGESIGSTQDYNDVPPDELLDLLSVVNFPD